MRIEFTDNSGLVKEELDAAVMRILEECGLVGEGYAARLCPVDTGNLRNSISHQVQASEQAVYIGTNSEYGPYVELGTGIYSPGEEILAMLVMLDLNDVALQYGQAELVELGLAVASWQTAEKLAALSAMSP